MGGIRSKRLVSTSENRRGPKGSPCCTPERDKIRQNVAPREKYNTIEPNQTVLGGKPSF